MEQNPATGKNAIFRMGVMVITLFTAASLYAGLLWSGMASAIGFELRYDAIFLPFFLGISLLIIARLPFPCVFPALVLVSTILCGLVLSGVWTAAVSDHSLLAGLFPNSDSYSYLNGSLNLLYNGDLPSRASRRPLSPAVTALLLLVFQENIKIVLAVMVFIVAITLALPTRELIRTHGWIAGYVVFLSLFLFYRRFIGTWLTEHMGLALGCIAFTLVWRSAHATRQSLIAALSGIFMLVLALCTRAGAFLILPALALWAGWAWRKNTQFSVRTFLLACVAITAGFALNAAVLYSIGNPGKAPMGNFPYVLYGLAHGGNWTKVLTDHPELQLLEEIDRNKTIYNLALKAIEDRPFSLLEGAVRAYRQMLFSTEGSYSFVFFGLQRSIRESVTQSVSTNVKGVTQKIIEEPLKYFQITATYLLFFSLSLFALKATCTLIRASNKLHGLLIFSVAGILASVPFAPPWDSDLMRAHAATMPFLIALPSIGVIETVLWLNRTDTSITGFTRNACGEDGSLLLVLALVVIPLVCVTPILMGIHKQGQNSISMKKSGMEKTEFNLFKLLPGSQVRLVSSNTNSPWSSNVKIETALRNMGVLRLAYPQRADEMAAAISTANRLALGYNISEGKLYHLALNETEATYLAHSPQLAKTQPVLDGEEVTWKRIQFSIPDVTGNFKR